MLVLNPDTNQMEDDGTGPPPPRVPFPQVAPVPADEVSPDDLKRDTSDPRHPYGPPLLGTTRSIQVADVHDDPASGKEMIPLAPAAGFTPGGATGPSSGASAGWSGDSALGPVAAPPPPPAPAPVSIGPTVETTSTRLSKEAKAGQADQVEALAHQGRLVQEVGADKVQAARDNAAEVKAAGEEKRIAEEQAAKDRATLQAKREAAQAEGDRIIADAEKTSLKDYWTDKPAGARILAVIGTAMGARSAAFLGGRNYAQDDLDNAIERDTRSKQAVLKQAIYKAGLKGTRAQEAFEFGTQEINLRKSAMLDKLADHKAALDAQHGIDEAKNDTAISASKLRMEAGRLREEFGHFADVKVHTSNELEQRAKMAAASAPEGASDSMIRGTDGQPVVTGTDAKGQAVYVRPHSAKAGETISAYRDKLPTVIANLSRLQEMAGGSAGDRARAIASGEAKALRHETAVTMATLENEGKAPSARLILTNESMIPEVSIATLRDPAKVYGQVRDRLIDRTGNIISSQTNANAPTAARLAREWSAGIAGRNGQTEGKRVKYRMGNGQVVDAIQHPDGSIEAVQ